MAKKFVSGATPLDYSAHGAPRQSPRVVFADALERARQLGIKHSPRYRRTKAEIKAAKQVADRIMGERDDA